MQNSVCNMSMSLIKLNEITLAIVNTTFLWVLVASVVVPQSRRTLFVMIPNILILTSLLDLHETIWGNRIYSWC